MKNMFQFSKYVRNARELDNWKMWFNSRGIYNELHSHIENVDGVAQLYFSLWREGEEAKEESKEHEDNFYNC